MADTQRTATVMVPADAAYTFISDPANLASFVSAMEHVETDVAEEGDLPPPDGELARFFADARTGTVEWSAPGAGFELSIALEQGTTRTSRITVTLRAGDDADAATLERMADDIVSTLRRVLRAG